MNPEIAMAVLDMPASGEHPVLLVDGERLDLLLARTAGQEHVEDLVPTLLGWASDEENSVALARMAPAEGQSAIAPMLLCPDDCDFACTLVVAEVETEGETVVWRRFGLDVGEWTPDPGQVGSQVDWFEGSGPYRFDRGQYEVVLGQFEEYRRQNVEP